MVIGGLRYYFPCALVRSCSLILAWCGQTAALGCGPGLHSPPLGLQLSWAGTLRSSWHRRVSGWLPGTLEVGVLAPTLPSLQQACCLCGREAQYGAQTFSAGLHHPPPTESLVQSEESQLWAC